MQSVFTVQTPLHPGAGVGVAVGATVGVAVGPGVPEGVGDGVGLGVGDGVGEGVGDGVEQIQLVAERQAAFLQNPLFAPVAFEQVNVDGQSLFVVQTELHSGTGVGEGEAVGVAVGEPVGRLKLKDVQLLTPAPACGMLEGTLGATGCCLS